MKMTCDVSTQATVDVVKERKGLLLADGSCQSDADDEVSRRKRTREGQHSVVSVETAVPILSESIRPHGRRTSDCRASSSTPATATASDDDREFDSDRGCCLHDARFTVRYHVGLIWRKAPELLYLLLHGTPRWLLKFARLVLFVVSLLPAFVAFVWYYATCDRVDVNYKPDGTSRHFADVYGSSTDVEQRDSGEGQKTAGESPDERLKPVVIFLTGGAWIIGYKMWGALLARALVPFGVLVVIPDYRNFPGVSIDEMVRDVDYSIQWTIDNCKRYNGDPERVVLVGQSAGAHLGSCVMMIKCLTEMGQKASSEYSLFTTYRAKDIRGFIPMSGPYDLVQMQKTFHDHGLDKNLVSAIFGQSVERYSPAHMLSRCQSLEDEHVADFIKNILPPIRLIHGTNDKTVPYKEAVNFAACLRNAGADVSTLMYDGWSHTDPILEGPMDGDQRFHREVYDCVRKWTDVRGEMGPFDETLPHCRPMCPRFLIFLGRFFNPF